MTLGSMGASGVETSSLASDAGIVSRDRGLGWAFHDGGRMRIFF